MKSLFSLFILFLLISCKSDITITDGEIREGQECFLIKTRNATFLYQKEAGGFSNIIDSKGVDWIQYNKTDTVGYPHSAAFDYRGLPNLVFGSDDDGCGHPGFNKMTSDKISENQIQSGSKSDKWQWVWTFHEKFAELEVEKTDPGHPYWFLFEGPVAGRFSPSTHYWGTDLEGPLTLQPDLVKNTDLYGRWQTVYFGDMNYGLTFFLKQIENDTLPDHFAYMGNTMQGNTSNDGMLVFGFGRGKGATPQIVKNQKFIIGFYKGRIKNKTDHVKILSYINKIAD